MMELLTQPQYAPMSMAEQVVAIYAGTQGYLDELEVGRVDEFGDELVKFVRERHPRVLQSIRETGELSEETETELKQAIEDCLERFRGAASGDPEKAEPE